MSLRHGYFLVSSTKLVVVGTRSKTSLLFRFTWPCVYPSLYGYAPPVSTRILSYFYEVPTSFVPPIHNQGVSLAPRQGLALWKIFLPTTGPLFVFYYWLFLPSATALFSGRFLLLLAFSFLFRQFLGGCQGRAQLVYLDPWQPHDTKNLDICQQFILLTWRRRGRGFGGRAPNIPLFCLFIYQLSFIVAGFNYQVIPDLSSQLRSSLRALLPPYADFKYSVGLWISFNIFAPS